MNVFIDNTNLLRVTSAKLTALNGSQSLLTETGTFTIMDSNGAEVAGQVWPTSLTLNSPGSYSGIIEADLALTHNARYTAIVTIGSTPSLTAEFNLSFQAKDRGTS